MDAFKIQDVPKIEKIVDLDKIIEARKKVLLKYIETRTPNYIKTDLFKDLVRELLPINERCVGPFFVMDKPNETS